MPILPTLSVAHEVHQAERMTRTQLLAQVAIHGNVTINQHWCTSCHQLRPCDAFECATEALLLMDELEHA